MSSFSLFTPINLTDKSKAPTLPIKLSDVNGSRINQFYRYFGVKALFPLISSTYNFSRNNRTAVLYPRVS